MYYGDTKKLEAMIKGRPGYELDKAVPRIRELERPENIMPLAACALKDLYPDIPPMLLAIAVRKAFVKAVNQHVHQRQSTLFDYAESYGTEPY